MTGPFKVLQAPLTIGPPATTVSSKEPGSGQSDGLLGWWKLAETSGSCAADASEHGAQATLKGTPHWASDSGPTGGGLEFDGKTNYLECRDPSETGASDRLSVAVWFKSRPADASGKKTQTLLAKGGVWQLQRAGHDGSLGLQVAGPALTKKGSDSGSIVSVRSKRNLDDGKWHHVVGVYNGQQLALYIDGEEESTVAASGEIAFTTLPVTMGESLTDRGCFFNGWMSDARVYSRALSAEQLRLLSKASDPR